jgi:hypothetical protein
MNSKESDSWWAFRISGRPQDLSSAARACAFDGVTLQERDRGEWLLTADRFEDRPPQEIRTEAAEILAALAGATSLQDATSEPLTIGHLSRIYTDGRRDTQVVISDGVFATSSVFLGGSVRTTTPDGVEVPAPPSLEEMAGAAAAAEPNLAYALGLYSKRPRTYDSLYKVLEVVKNHGYLSKGSEFETRLRRFKAVANSETAAGPDARHARRESDSTSERMELTEATRLFKEVLTDWVRAVLDQQSSG